MGIWDKWRFVHLLFYLQTCFTQVGETYQKMVRILKTMSDTLELKVRKEPRKRKPLDRKPYIELIGMTNLGLCNFCKFAEWEGWTCQEMDLHCKHPLEVINGSDCLHEDHPNDTWCGGDCWGFRPKESLQRIGVYVGICLEGNIPHYSASHNNEIIAIIPSKRDKEERYW